MLPDGGCRRNNFAILLGPEVPHDVFKCDIYSCIVVCMCWEKNFHNKRQNERKIEFIGAGTAGRLKEEQMVFLGW